MSDWWQQDQIAAPAAPAAGGDKWWERDQGVLTPAQGTTGGLMGPGGSVVQRSWAAPASVQPTSFMGQVGADVGGMVDSLTAGLQGTSPVVKDRTGADQYKRVGDYVQLSPGSWPGMGTGSDPVPAWIVPKSATPGNPRGVYGPLDPQKHVVLRDPATGDMAVYERTPQTAETVGALGRIVTGGAMSSAPTRIAGAVGATVKGAEPAISAFTRAGVTPSWAAVGGRGTRKIYNFGRDFFATAGPLEKADTASLVSTRQQVGELATKYGTVETPERAGTALVQGAEKFKQGFKGTAQRLFGAVDAAIPSGTRVAADATVQTISDIVGRFQDPVLAAKFLDTNVKDLREAIGRGMGTLAWQDARAFRQEVGKMLRTPVAMSDFDRAQIEKLYGSLSQDLGKTADAAGAGALWTRANNYYSAGQKRIKGALAELLKPDQTGENAFALLGKSAKAPGIGVSRGNLAKLTAIKRSMPADEWGTAVATTLEQMGKPTAGTTSGTIEGASGFSPSTFMTQYDAMSPEARNLLFDKPGLQAALDDLAKVVTSQKAMKLAGNPSGTAGISSIVAVLGGMGADSLKTISGVVGAHGMARLMTRPAFVRWLAGATKQGMPKLPSAVARLSQLARIDPALRDAASALESYLQPAAASDNGSGQPLPRVPQTR